MGRTVHRPNTALLELVVESACPYDRLAALVNTVGAEAGTALRYRAPSICQWIDGARPRDPAVCAYIAEALARRLGRPVMPADIGLAPVGEAPLALAWGVEPAKALSTLGREIVERRSLITHGAYTLAAAWGIPGWPEIADRGAHAAATPGTRIGIGDVDAVRRMTELFRDVGDRNGSGQVRATATSFLTHEVAGYLRAEAGESVRRELHVAASRLAYLVGWYSWDSELHQLAQIQYTVSAKLAASADDASSYANALRGMSVQASGLGHHSTAAHLAERAVTASGGPGAEPRARAFVLAALAVAAGGQRDRRAAHAHLTATDSALEQASNRPDTTGRFHGASLEYTAALTHQALGDTRDAEAAMTRSMRLRPGDERRHRAVAAGILAETRLDLGHLEHACAAWRQVLDDADYLRCGQLDTAISTMRARLRPHTRHPAAAALLARSSRPRG